MGVVLAELQPVVSKAYVWEDLKIERSGSEKVRNILEGPTDGFEYLHMFTTTVEPGMAAPKSQVHQDLEELIIIKPSAKGGRRNIMRQPTSIIKEFEMHVTTLDEGMKSHDPHSHVVEEIILVRYGQEFIDGKFYPAGPGSVIFLGSNVPHGIRNIGNGPCEYYAFQWRLR